MLRPRNLLVLVLALLAAGGVTYAWLLSRDLADLRLQLAASRKGAEELQKKLFEAEKRPARTVPAVETATGAPSAPEEGGPPAAVESQGRNRGPNPRNNFMAEIMADPKVAPLLLEQRKRALDQRYAALFRKLNLPPEQLEKLKTLLAEKELSRADAMTLARGQGLRGEDLRAMTQQADAESDAQIKALLGDANYTQLAQYDKTTSQRNAVSQFAERLSYGATPLTAQQNDQLVQILAANPMPAIGGRNNVPEFATLAGGFGGGRGPDLGGMMGMMVGRGTSDEDIAKYTAAKTERDALVLQQASTVLSSAQLQALQQQQQEENNQIQLMQLMRAKAQQEFGGQVRGNRRNGGGG